MRWTDIPLTIFAHMFNRKETTFPIGISMIIVAFRFNTWMEVNEYI